MNILKRRTSAERAVMALLDRDLPHAVTPDGAHRVGGSPPKSIDLFHVEVSTSPGGSSDRLNVYTVVDIDIYARSFETAESGAFAIEALVLGYPHVVEVGDRKVVIDRVEQNDGPADRPWHDDSVHRLGATYVIVTRRS